MSPNNDFIREIKLNAKNTVLKNFLSFIAVILIFGIINYVVMLLASAAAYRAYPDFFDKTVKLVAQNPDANQLISVINSFDYQRLLSSMLLFGLVVFLGVVFSSPLLFGIMEFFYCVSKEEKRSILDIFSWFGDFKRFFKAMGFFVLILFITLFWVLVYTAAPLALIIVFKNNLLFTFLLFISAIMSLYRTMTYVPALIMFSRDPSKPVFEILKETQKTIKPYRLLFFLLNLSFWPWYLLWFALSLFIPLGVVFVYLIPYHIMSIILFYREIKVK